MQTLDIGFSNLEERLAAMRLRPDDPKAPFYALTLTAEDDGQVVLGMQSRWVGYADAERRVEIREASLVFARMAEAWDDIGRPGVFVRTSDELLIFFLLGGNALIEPALAEEAIGDLLKPDHALLLGRAGFVSPNLAGPSALRRAPTPKLRMSVLKRDGRRCRICGRSPDNHLDLELHVHHIRPWEHSGITNPANLITLCQTCHRGLEPHYDASLFDYLGAGDVVSLAAEFAKGVANYRRVTAIDYGRAEGDSLKKGSE